MGIENQRFLLESSAPGFVEAPEMIEDYSEEILLNINEEGRKKITRLGSIFRRIIGYKDSAQKRYLTNLFGEFYDSLDDLKKQLRRGGLEKTAASIRMINPNKSKFGVISYINDKGNQKTFGYYRTIK